MGYVFWPPRETPNSFLVCENCGQPAELKVALAGVEVCEACLRTALRYLENRRDTEKAVEEAGLK